jgi:hypothetical protein
MSRTYLKVFQNWSELSLCCFCPTPNLFASLLISVKLRSSLKKLATVASSSSPPVSSSSPDHFASGSETFPDPGHPMDVVSPPSLAQAAPAQSKCYHLPKNTPMSLPPWGPPKPEFLKCSVWIFVVASLALFPCVLGVSVLMTEFPEHSYSGFGVSGWSSDKSYSFGCFLISSGPSFLFCKMG